MSEGKKIIGLIAGIMISAVLWFGQNSHAAQELEQEPLKDLFSEYFTVGVAVQAIDHWNDPTAEIGNPQKEACIEWNFNSMTFGNELKPAYNFDPESETLFRIDPAAKELLDWAKEHQIPVRGHVIVWHSQVDPSIFAKDFKALSGGRVTKNENDPLDEDCLTDRNTLIERLRTYIYGLTEYMYASKYADVIYAWDVVNEASDETQPDGMRHSMWYQIIGPEYLYYSFLFAREAQILYSGQYASLYGMSEKDDDLSSIRPLLFYNDYNEWYNTRCSAILRFLTEDVFNPGQQEIESPVIRADGNGTIWGDGLLDGIGMQAHMDDSQNLDTYMDALERYDAAVGRVHITELDVGQTGLPGKKEEKQAQFYHSFFTRLMEEKEKGVNLENVTFWGLTDDASWRQGANPLLYADGTLNPKPAWYAVAAAAKGEDYTASPAERDDSGSLTETIDFEPYKENGTTVTVPPESAGFFGKGENGTSILTLSNTQNHTKDAPIGFSLRAQRDSAAASVKKELDSWTGMTIEVSLYAMSEDPEYILSLEYGMDGETVCEELSRISGGSDWTELNASCMVPDGCASPVLVIRTDGESDLFIDDLRISSVQAK